LANLRADTAALVAAQLTQARMALMGGILAGRQQGTKVTVQNDLVETTYRHFLAVVLDQKTDAAVLDLSDFSKMD
jgi:hypothetical protein